MTDLRALFPDELRAALQAMGESAYRAEQIFPLLAAGVPFEGMSALPAALRLRLQNECPPAPQVAQEFVSGKDGTRKMLFRMADGALVEGVLMDYRHGATMCLSTQVGCRMGCAFCASTLHGLERNLRAGEMAAMVACAHRALGGGEGRRIHNLVLMGSGEPFDNYDEVVRFLRLISHQKGLGIGMRHISLSTCGLVEPMRRFAAEGLPLTLCISLHAPTDELRARLIPAAKANPLQEIIEVCGEYIRISGRRVIFEYALIRGVNDQKTHAAQLRALLRGLQAHVNLIPLNDVPERSLRGVSRGEARAFAAALCDMGLSATVRREMGADIQGACGQLRNRFQGNDEP